DRPHLLWVLAAKTRAGVGGSRRAEVAGRTPEAVGGWRHRRAAVAAGAGATGANADRVLASALATGGGRAGPGHRGAARARRGGAAAGTARCLAAPARNRWVG